VLLIGGVTDNLINDVTLEDPESDPIAELLDSSALYLQNYSRFPARRASFFFEVGPESRSS
jgi:hypothetical protein